jgi:type III secretory pathway lipoprotein EscJ
VHAVVVNVTIHDFDRAVETLNERIVPAVSQAPGFIAGYWTRSEDNHGHSVIAVESEDAARAIAEMIQAQAPQNDAVTLESVEVREVVANA